MKDVASTPIAEGRATRDGIIRTLVRNPLALLASLILVVVVLVAIFAPLIAPFAPSDLQIFKVNAPPGDGFLLGGDSSGRDIWSRLLFSTRNTLLGAVIAVGVASAIGVIFGLAAGYYGRSLDTVASWVFDGLMALPALIVLLALFQALNSSIYMSMAVFGVMLSPGFFRLTRTLVNGVKSELYVDAARVSGLSDSRIITRHILKVIRGPVIIQLSIMAGVAIIIQSGLEFLGLGDPSTPTWGGMLQDAFANIYVRPIAILWPGMAISITVASLVLLGNALRDALQGFRSGSHGQALKRSINTTPAKVENSADENVVLEVRDLVVGYPSGDGYTEVVQGASFKLRSGDVLGLVGESGSGKTQTAFAILGLLSAGGRILSGSIFFEGKDLSRMGENEISKLRGLKIAYVPQEPMSNLDPAFKIGEQLCEPIQTVLGVSHSEAKQRALKLLARVGIVDPERTFKAYPHQISGGMAQRVLIAGAVACEPTLLIADEPTTALDVTVQAEVLELMRDLQRDTGMSMVMVTHNFGVVADICDHVAVMRKGEVVEANEVQTLFAAPSHEYTKMLLDAVLEDSTVRTYKMPEASA